MLPSDARLRRGRDFREIYRRGRHFNSGALSLYCWFDRIGRPSLPVRSALIGFTISKKVARYANDRNLIKRRLREICRHELLSVLPGDARLVFVARKSVLGADFTTLRADVLKLSSMAGLFRGDVPMTKGTAEAAAGE